MRNYILGIVSVLIILAIAGGAYFYGVKKSTPNNLETSIDPTITAKTTPTITPTPTPTVEPEVNLSEQIIAAITSKNTAALKGYMTDTVQVRLEASSCCGPITKEEAISQLSYLDPAVGWNFDPTNQIQLDLALASPDYYGAGWLVGVANNEYIVSFKINSNSKIEAYNLGATYKLLLP
jgi:hypothetical protein